jgi:glyoxylase-like metal-dependent hydrolase (beta-lactamase superfamily II)
MRRDRTGAEGAEALGALGALGALSDQGPSGIFDSITVPLSAFSAPSALPMRLPFIALALALQVALASAQTPSGFTWTSNVRARAVLDKAIRAHGGEEQLRGIDDATVEYAGRQWMAYQSPTLTKPWNIQRTQSRVIYDLKNRRIRRDNVARYPLDFAFHNRSVVTDTGGFGIDPTRAATGDVFFRIPRQAWEQSRQGISREIPGVMLLALRERAPTLRSLGQTVERGRRFDVITAAEPDGGQLTLYFDAITSLLSRTEILRDDPVDGDMVVSVTFDNYRDVGGLPMAGRRTERRNGELARDDTVRITLAARPHDSLFVFPAGYAEPPADLGPEGEAVRKLGDNIYLLQQLRGGNRVMLVVFSDHVLVFETPVIAAGTTIVSDAVIAAANQVAPGKPIRYVTFSHHHDDHGAGLRGYIARGITIVTTPRNKAFVERVAATVHTLRPDALSRTPRTPVIETFEKKRVFTDGTMTMELYDIGPTSHVDEIVLAYFPNERLIFQGDLVIYPTHGSAPPANTLTREFARWIDQSGLDVERIAGVHGRVIGRAELSAMVAQPNPGQR